MALVSSIPAEAKRRTPPGFQGATLKLLWQKVTTPGDFPWLEGASWFPSTNCKNKVSFTITDSAGKSFSAGSLLPDSSDGFQGTLYGGVGVPLGVRGGTATLKGVQRLKVKFPVVGCISFARKQGHIKIKIDAEEGDGPPVIGSAYVPTIRQGRPGTVTWSVSQPGMSNIRVGYEFTPTRIFWIENVLNESRPAGGNTFAWNGLDGGKVLPPGAYRMEFEATNAAGSKAAPRVVRFAVTP